MRIAIMLLLLIVSMGAKYPNPFVQLTKWMINRLPGTTNDYTGELRQHLLTEHESPKEILTWTVEAVKRLHDNLHNEGKSGVFVIQGGNKTESDRFYGLRGLKIIVEREIQLPIYQQAAPQSFDDSYYYGSLMGNLPKNNGCGNPNCAMCYGGGSIRGNYSSPMQGGCGNPRCAMCYGN